MININEELLFLKYDSELSCDIHESIDETIALIRSRLNCCLRPDQISSTQRTQQFAFIKYFSDIPRNITLDTSLVEAWYQYVLSYDTRHSEELVRSILGKVSDTENIPFIPCLSRRLRASLQILLLFLYCKKSLLLTYKFPHIRCDWLEDSSLDVPCYTECIRFIRSFDKHRTTNNTEFLAKAKNKTLMQLFGQGMKMLVASTWYTPEDINLDELLGWRSAQSNSSYSTSSLNIAPLPINSIVTAFHEQYKGRFPISPDQWRQAAPPGTRSSDERSRVLTRSITNGLDALDIAKGIICSKLLSTISFSCGLIDAYGICATLKSIGIDIDDAYKSWTACQKAYLDASKYEKETIARTALGRLNIYLFLYLPLWMQQHPLAPKNLYPAHPNEFRAGIHFTESSLIQNTERPMTYMEFHSICGISKSWQGITVIKRFFEFLIQYADSLPGCDGVKQPVHRIDIPRSKKYTSVNKNIFPARLLSLLLRFLYGLESLQEYILKNNSDPITLINGNTGDDPNLLNAMVNTLQIGYVPLVHHDKRLIKISQVHTGFMNILNINGNNIYCPAILRHAIGMIETGLRGQAIQWLDADTYDKGVDRTAMHPSDLNSLWVNTDKTKTQGFYSLVSNRVIELFDKQKSWRDDLIQRGVTAFKSSVYYDDNQSSQWGRITPLFSFDTINGSPFCDATYNRGWSSLCYSFQLWLWEHGLNDDRLVAYIPAPASRNKLYFKWEDWAKGLKEEDVIVLSQAMACKRLNLSKSSVWGSMCPVSLRAYVTPHGARASFVSSMVTVLPAEYIGTYLTGQATQTVHYYTKPNVDYIAKLRNVHLNQFADDNNGSTEQTSHQHLSSKKILRDIVNSLRESSDISQTIKDNGLISLVFNESESPIKITGLEIITSSKAASIGEADTHLCPVNFECPKEVILTLKTSRRCSLCPYAIYPVNLLPRIAAKRHQMAELTISVQRKLNEYSLRANVMQYELDALENQLNIMAEDAIGWRIIEESLWHLVEQRRKGETNQKYLIRQPDIVTSHLARVSVIPGSTDEFIERLSEITIFPSSETPDMTRKIDRAKRLLLAAAGDIYKALVEPPSSSPATEVVGLLLAAMEARNINIDEVIKLLNLTHDQWNDQLFPPNSSLPLLLKGTFTDEKAI